MLVVVIAEILYCVYKNGLDLLIWSFQKTILFLRLYKNIASMLDTKESQL